MDGGHDVNGLKQDDTLSPHSHPSNDAMSSQQQQWVPQMYQSQHQQQQQQQYSHYHQPQSQGWNGQGSWSPGMPGVEITDADIVISTGLEHSRSREGNLEYQRLLMANSMLWHSLPSHYQTVHAQHLYHFLTHVRGRRFLQCIAPNVYVPFQGGPFQIAQEIAGDPCKMAFQSRNPCWMLDGMQLLTTSADPATEVGWAHRGNPRGNEWGEVGVDRVKEILKEEGPVHLIVLPAGIEIKSVVSMKTEGNDTDENVDEGARDSTKDSPLNGGHHPTKKEEHDPSHPDHDGSAENTPNSDDLGEEETDNIIQVAEQVMGRMEQEQSDGDLEQTLDVGDGPLESNESPAVVDSHDSIESDSPKRERSNPHAHDNGIEFELDTTDQRQKRVRN
eukprot:CAMPEP_0168725558 /NCGR_PEP_ID=MMETSP0724-20121128/4217_1 /TAXON_ID=265536 /ORGANISM="Amphiprora sp., Strain CCMP467" /LENGTH=388 /DNA_ID=CAMNT_0008772349 /DNA_START=27 /DNA_END=1193 /DNA_ORIENTATION=+